MSSVVRGVGLARSRKKAAILSSWVKHRNSNRYQQIFYFAGVQIQCVNGEPLWKHNVTGFRHFLVGPKTKGYYTRALRSADCPKREIVVFARPQLVYHTDDRCPVLQRQSLFEDAS
jgi:hypothetical protein